MEDLELLRKSKHSKMNSRDMKVLLDIEDLIRQLYYHEGAALKIHELEEEYKENIKFIDIVNDLRKSVDQIIDELVSDYYEYDPIPRDPNQVRQDVIELRRFRNDVKKEKNHFVRACNKLAAEYEAKSALEKQMHEWKEKLVSICKNPEKCNPDDKDLMEDLDEVRQLLKDDTVQVITLIGASS